MPGPPVTHLALDVAGKESAHSQTEWVSAVTIAARSPKSLSSEDVRVDGTHTTANSLDLR